MSQIKRKTNFYSEETENTILQEMEEGKTLALVARENGIRESTIHGWQDKRAQSGVNAKLVKAKRRLNYASQCRDDKADAASTSPIPGDQPTSASTAKSSLIQEQSTNLWEAEINGLVALYKLKHGDDKYLPKYIANLWHHPRFKNSSV
ncbi:uncharacterized protein LOC107981464 [Nasonia vitripennis]|uniref:Uncharacterized protein n=1 Tax=Nasonia vitripennis TaxID=7425 RepID=A0A7M7QFI2_NASVI|nr:uncharacterized protein LOC107981464 [Nasonia vitripennis]